MPAAAAQPPHKTWTRREVETLEAAGLLAGTHFELIDGEVFDKMGQNPRHASAVRRLAAALITIFGVEFVSVQLPVETSPADAPRNLPEPDVTVTREPESAYRRRHPEAADIHLIAEVADSTYDYDVKRKGHLYARAGFQEYLVVDLTDRQLMVLRSPREGVYREIQVLRPGDIFHPLAAPESGIAADQLLAE